MHGDPEPRPDTQGWPHKNNGGIKRVINATRYSWAGLRAAWAWEIAFRQEVFVGVPFLCAVPWLAPGRAEGVLMALVIIAIWVVELLNSAVEAVADTITIEHHPLIGRAKDLGSAAVLLTLIGAGLTWLVLLWPAR